MSPLQPRRACSNYFTLAIRRRERQTSWWAQPVVHAIFINIILYLVAPLIVFMGIVLDLLLWTPISVLVWIAREVHIFVGVTCFIGGCYLVVWGG